MAENRFSSKKILIVIFILLVIFALGYLVFMFLNGQLISLGSATSSKMIETELKLKYDFNSNAGFAAAQKGFYFNTKDGIKFFSTDGSEKMSSTSSFIAPTIYSEGDFCVVYEHNSTAINVYNTEGLLYSKTMDFPIVSAAINKKGNCSVTIKKSDGYEVYLYNENGISVKKYMLNDERAFPVAADISDDGRILAISILDFSTVEPISKLIFIYANSSEWINYQDGQFAAFQFSGEFVGIIKFIEKNKLIVISEKTITLLDVEGGCKVIWKLEPGNQIDHFAMINETNFAVAFGEPITNSESEKAGLVRIYNSDLIVTGELQLDEKADLMFAGFDSVVVSSSNKLTAIGVSGEVLWNYNSLSDVKQFILFEDYSNLLIASSSEAQAFKLTKIKEETVE